MRDRAEVVQRDRDLVVHRAVVALEHWRVPQHCFGLFFFADRVEHGRECCAVGGDVDVVGRNRQRAEQIPLEDVHEELAAAARNSELARGIREALARLPPKQRQAVWLKLVRGCSFGEVAYLLGGSEAAAKMRIQRASRR